MNVGHHGLRRFAAEPGAGARRQRLQLGDHLAQVFSVHAAGLAQGGQVAPRQQLQILQQGAHRRIEAVALDQLQRQAFGD